jgi:glucose/arabinose dehydrogenase
MYDMTFIRWGLFVLAAGAFASVSAQTAFTGNPPRPKPAFPRQTEAPKPAKPSPELKVETITTRLNSPFSLAFLPDGTFLVTESAGTMRIVRKDGVVFAPLGGVPDVKAVAAQGLHDVVLDPDFARNRALYFNYFAPPPGEAPAIWPNEFFYDYVWNKPLAERRTIQIGTERTASAKLSADGRHLEDVKTLAEGAERRIVIAPDGKPLITGADRFRFYQSDYDGEEHDFTDNPDLTRNFSGRVLRINRDGSIPPDNPWLSRATVEATTFAHGLRDPEGAAINPATGELWVTDHGPQGGDEINIIRAGKDYGWPNVSYGTQYDARRTDGRKNVPVGNGKASMPGVEEPAYWWIPDIAPSGMMFYTGNLFPDWRGSVFIGGLEARALVRLVLDKNEVIAEERLLLDLKQSIRDIRQGPDGAVYLLTRSCSLLRITPKA